MEQERILIVDDEIVLSRSLAIAFEGKGYEIATADSGEEAITLLETFSPHLVLLDLRLPGMNGIQVLEKISAWNREVPVIIMTAYGDTQTTVQAVKRGAFNFINKPFELEDIRLLVGQALEDRNFRKEYEYLKYQQRRFYRFSDLVGQSPEMKEVYKQIDILSHAGDTTVLIRGQSGTGKELVASAIHYRSKRNKAPFIEINCASLPETIIESELFGYEKGAFTDAKKDKKGLLELGDNGTVFLDEIGDMPLPAQAKLLRFLEKKQFKRLGSGRDIKVDVRIVAATNKNLETAIKNGEFRQDLFYRLNVITLYMPPLKERKDDILLLADYFLNEFCRDMKKPPKKISEPVKQIFTRYPWEGNVRELRNVIERAVIFTKGDTIETKVLPPEFKQGTGLHEKPVMEHDSETPAPDPGHDLKTAMDQFENRIIRNALEKAKGNKTETGRILGISRFALNRRMERLNIILPPG
ncbi:MULTISPECIES: sigma-54-dependent transcriptional regulator [Desulfobacula]|uniref:Two component system response regulator, sigma54-specific n=2 Tax=Desulfobacula TaxID=28222 RepID=K0N6U8_DESTT|nr:MULTISPECIES: sigma-54 dependent transcriptional regulator [Desulfobacula]CCK79719.1 two component system response regulator, sigma54-specific [Desulfobacula toluolica Tol2]SDU59378.1 two-component system, NtrC family, response regulator AtoC [Desulfobacula phenolica]